jgi:hypothetical protein
MRQTISITIEQSVVASNWAYEQVKESLEARHGMVEGHVTKLKLIKRLGLLLEERHGGAMVSNSLRMVVRSNLFQSDDYFSFDVSFSKIPESFSNLT